MSLFSEIGKHCFPPVSTYTTYKPNESSILFSLPSVGETIYLPLSTLLPSIAEPYHIEAIIQKVFPERSLFDHDGDVFAYVLVEIQSQEILHFFPRRKHFLLKVEEEWNHSEPSQNTFTIEIQKQLEQAPWLVGMLLENSDGGYFGFISSMNNFVTFHNGFYRCHDSVKYISATSTDWKTMVPESLYIRRWKPKPFVTIPSSDLFLQKIKIPIISYSSKPNAAHLFGLPLHSKLLDTLQLDISTFQSRISITSLKPKHIQPSPRLIKRMRHGKVYSSLLKHMALSPFFPKEHRHSPPSQTRSYVYIQIHHQRLLASLWPVFHEYMSYSQVSLQTSDADAYCETCGVLHDKLERIAARMLRKTKSDVCDIYQLTKSWPIYQYEAELSLTMNDYYQLESPSHRLSWLHYFQPSPKTKQFLDLSFRLDLQHPEQWKSECIRLSSIEIQKDLLIPLEMELSSDQRATLEWMWKRETQSDWTNDFLCTMESKDPHTNESLHTFYLDTHKDMSIIRERLFEKISGGILADPYGNEWMFLSFLRFELLQTKTFHKTLLVCPKWKCEVWQILLKQNTSWCNAFILISLDDWNATDNFLLTILPLEELEEKDGNSLQDLHPKRRLFLETSEWYRVVLDSPECMSPNNVLPLLYCQRRWCLLNQPFSSVCLRTCSIFLQLTSTRMDEFQLPTIELASFVTRLCHSPRQLNSSMLMEIILEVHLTSTKREEHNQWISTLKQNKSIQDWEKMAIAMLQSYMHQDFTLTKTESCIIHMKHYEDTPINHHHPEKKFGMKDAIAMSPSVRHSFLHQTEERICPICLASDAEYFESQTKREWVQTTCNHFVCLTCLHVLVHEMNETYKCPMCRSPSIYTSDSIFETKQLVERKKMIVDDTIKHGLISSKIGALKRVLLQPGQSVLVLYVYESTAKEVFDYLADDVERYEQSSSHSKKYILLSVRDAFVKDLSWCTCAYILDVIPRIDLWLRVRSNFFLFPRTQKPLVLHHILVQDSFEHRYFINQKKRISNQLTSIRNCIKEKMFIDMTKDELYHLL